MEKIYLDNSATTKVDRKVADAMAPYFGEIFGNPSSIHSFGQEARQAVDRARDTVADFLNCKKTEVIFTSGGSESDNLAIRGMVDHFCHSCESRNRKIHGQARDDNVSKPHIIISAIEHHAVLHTVQDLEKEGKIEASYIKPDRNGIVAVSDIEKAIRDNTVLISVMYVNNEVGTIQPIREIGKMVERINSQRIKNQELRIKQKECHSRSSRESTILDPRVIGLGGREPRRKPEDDKEERIYFHTDAAQAAEYLNMDVDYLHVDLLTLSAHKIHGPKGIGALFVRKGTPIEPQISGGEQEFKLRAGTENVAAIVGLSSAIAEIKNQNNIDCHSEPVRHTQGKFHEESQRSFADAQDDNCSRARKLRDKLEDSILKNIPETYLNGDREKRAPHILNISFKNAEGEAIILNLDFLGIAVSSGSACTSRSLEPSHVLSAMGVPHELSHGAIRFSLSRETTEEEIDKVIEVLPVIIKKLREMSPLE